MIWTMPLRETGLRDVALVGGKNACVIFKPAIATRLGHEELALLRPNGFASMARNGTPKGAPA